MRVRRGNIPNMAPSYTRHVITAGDYLFTGIVLSIIGAVLIATGLSAGWVLVVGGSIPLTIGTIALGVRVGLEDVAQRRTD